MGQEKPLETQHFWYKRASCPGLCSQALSPQSHSGEMYEEPHPKQPPPLKNIAFPVRHEAVWPGLFLAWGTLSKPLGVPNEAVGKYKGEERKQEVGGEMGAGVCSWSTLAQPHFGKGEKEGLLVGAHQLLPTLGRPE